MTTEVIVRKWGNSLGVILPKELVESEHLAEKDRVFIQAIKKGNLSDIFGSRKTGMSGQKFKDMVRSGWPK